MMANMCHMWYLSVKPGFSCFLGLRTFVWSQPLMQSLSSPAKTRSWEAIKHHRQTPLCQKIMKPLQINKNLEQLSGKSETMGKPPSKIMETYGKSDTYDTCNWDSLCQQLEGWCQWHGGGLDRHAAPALKNAKRESTKGKRHKKQDPTRSSKILQEEKELHPF